MTSLQAMLRYMKASIRANDTARIDTWDGETLHDVFCLALPTVGFEQWCQLRKLQVEDDQDQEAPLDIEEQKDRRDDALTEEEIIANNEAMVKAMRNDMTIGDVIKV